MAEGDWRPIVPSIDDIGSNVDKRRNLPSQFDVMPSDRAQREEGRNRNGKGKSVVTRSGQLPWF